MKFFILYYVVATIFCLYREFRYIIRFREKPEFTYFLFNVLAGWIIFPFALIFLFFDSINNREKHQDFNRLWQNEKDHL